MDYLLLLVAMVYAFLFFKALGRLMICSFNIKLFLSESTYAWMGFFFLFNLVAIIAAAFIMVIKAMVDATL
jgi:hypothetical protein